MRLEPGVGSGKQASGLESFRWRRMLQWFRERKRTLCSRLPRKLLLRETLALGERRFVAVVEFEEQKFLIGATGSSLSILAALNQRSGSRSDDDNLPTWVFDGSKQLERLMSESPC